MIIRLNFVNLLHCLIILLVFPARFTASGDNEIVDFMYVCMYVCYCLHIVLIFLCLSNFFSLFTYYFIVLFLNQCLKGMKGLSIYTTGSTHSAIKL